MNAYRNKIRQAFILKRIGIEKHSNAYPFFMFPKVVK